MAAVGASGLCVAQPAEPTRPQARIALGIGQSDNVNRDAASVRSDMARLETGFSGRIDRQRLRGALAGDLEFLKYGAEEIADDSEVLGSVDGLLELHLVPDRFHWDVQYGYGQTRLDYLGPIGPSNRQTTTVATTGPSLLVPLGSRNALEFGALVSERTYEETSEFDNRLTTLRLGFTRAISAVTSISFKLEERENEYDDDPTVYEFELASLEYRRELASGEAVASLGRGRVEIGGISQPTTVSRLAWNRAVGARSHLEICAGSELTDAGSVFAGGGGAVSCRGELNSALTYVDNITQGRWQDAISSKSPVKRESIGVRFDVDGAVADFRLIVGASQDSFEIDPASNNDSSTISLYASRQFTPLWRGEASLLRWDQDFEAAGESEDQSLRLALSRALADAAFLEFSLRRDRRVGGLNPFDENQLFLSFGRTFGGP
jgi:hypothetical protein